MCPTLHVEVFALSIGLCECLNVPYLVCGGVRNGCMHVEIQKTCFLQDLFWLACLTCLSVYVCLWALLAERGSSQKICEDLAYKLVAVVIFSSRLAM